MDDEELQRLIEQAKRESLQSYHQQQQMAAEQRQGGGGGGEEASAASIVAGLGSTIEEKGREETSKEEAGRVNSGLSGQQSLPMKSFQPSGELGEREGSQPVTSQTASKSGRQTGEGSQMEIQQTSNQITQTVMSQMGDQTESGLQTVMQQMATQTEGMWTGHTGNQTENSSLTGAHQITSQTQGSLPPLTRLTHSLPGLGDSAGAGDDAMARWLEEATSNTDGDSTTDSTTAAPHSPATLLSSVRQVCIRLNIPN